MKYLKKRNDRIFSTDFWHFICKKSQLHFHCLVSWPWQRTRNFNLHQFSFESLKSYTLLYFLHLPSLSMKLLTRSMTFDASIPIGWGSVFVYFAYQHASIIQIAQYDNSRRLLQWSYIVCIIRIFSLKSIHPMIQKGARDWSLL